MLTDPALERPDPGLHRLNSEKLVEQTVVVLRDQILSGNYAAGQNLPSQGELCIELGVSRSVVREAMRTLQSQGLITVSQGKRPSVLPAGPRAVIETLSTLVERSQVSLLELLEVRRPLELEIAELAAQRRTGEHLAKLHASIVALEAAEDMETGIAADSRFHKILAEASGNPLFGIVLDVFASLLRDSRRQTIRQSGMDMAVSYHRQILAAVEAGDANSARSLMAAHMRQTEIDIRKSREEE